jgi:hypothetical protein
MGRCNFALCWSLDGCSYLLNVLDIRLPITIMNRRYSRTQVHVEPYLKKKKKLEPCLKKKKKKNSHNITVMRCVKQKKECAFFEHFCTRCRIFKSFTPIWEQWKLCRTFESRRWDLFVRLYGTSDTKPTTSFTGESCPLTRVQKVTVDRADWYSSRWTISRILRAVRESRARIFWTCDSSSLIRCSTASRLELYFHFYACLARALPSEHTDELNFTWETLAKPQRFRRSYDEYIGWSTSDEDCSMKSDNPLIDQIWTLAHVFHLGIFSLRITGVEVSNK